tara:strand:- start:351 stop:779 length:429 start_codon:yes stop_codon:yes gene_type:complete
MRLDMERICQLAGVKHSSRSKSGYGVLSEGKVSRRGRLLRESTGHEDVSEMDEDEIIEVDEKELVQELRRARRLMAESKKRKAIKKQQLQEMQLKGIIDQEVKNVLKELQLNSGWVYGKNKPRRSRKGYTHQGSFLKGIGFK